MQAPNRKAAFGIARLFAMLTAIIFLPVWTFNYWQGWVCLLAFFGPCIAITVYVAKNDPALLERRLKTGASAETVPAQKIIQVVTFVAFLADFVVSALDHRFRWSTVPVWAALFADILILVGFAMVFVVFRANSYTSGIIEVAPEQKVISTGPYAVVRHPMYSGALLMLIGIPLALGSWWGELANVLMTAALACRLLNEEKFLTANLPGYREYHKAVKYRLVPLVW
jgi:protein-S-isoprenylcysteine O-methyltransferase Ste14